MSNYDCKSYSTLSFHIFQCARCTKIFFSVCIKGQIHNSMTWYPQHLLQQSHVIRHETTLLAGLKCSLYWQPLHDEWDQAFPDFPALILNAGRGLGMRLVNPCLLSSKFRPHFAFTSLVERAHGEKKKSLVLWATFLVVGRWGFTLI